MTALKYDLVTKYIDLCHGGANLSPMIAKKAGVGTPASDYRRLL